MGRKRGTQKMFKGVMEKEIYQTERTETEMAGGYRDRKERVCVCLLLNSRNHCDTGFKLKDTTVCCFFFMYILPFCIDNGVATIFQKVITYHVL